MSIKRLTLVLVSAWLGIAITQIKLVPVPLPPGLAYLADTISTLQEDISVVESRI